MTTNEPINSISRNRDGSTMYIRHTWRPATPNFISHGPIIQKAVRSPDGSWKMWTYDEGQNPGAPLRAKSRQQQIAEFAASVQAAIDAADSADDDQALADLVSDDQTASVLLSAAVAVQ